MTQFDHERLDVYNTSIELVAWCDTLIESLEGRHRHARDQLARSSLSIPLNIAEGIGKRSMNDRRRYLEIARGSAMESAAALDVLIAQRGLSAKDADPGKVLLFRIVSMLTRMTDNRKE